MREGRRVPSGIVWATRGRTWGFRFLLNAGLADPLAEYERVFADLKDEPTAWIRLVGRVGLRFPDPDGRRDAAGRIIPHEFVILGSQANRIQSLDAGKEWVWPRVAGAYQRVWNADRPPSSEELRFDEQQPPFPRPRRHQRPGGRRG